MTAGESVVEAVRAARESLVFDDQIAKLKRAVSDEMRRIDPGLKIAKTEYFNHSYVPDLVASWREGGKLHERGVFIRGSLRTVVAANDLKGLEDQAPVLIGISDEPNETWEKLRRQVKKSTRSLATEITATSRLRTSMGHSRPEAQLSGLVRANLVRGGRGLLSDSDADTIVAVEDKSPKEALESFGETVRELFVGATAKRLSRTAGLLHAFFEDSLSVAALADLEKRPLSESELEVVIPFIVSRAADVSNDRVWSLLGQMLGLETLESMSAALDGLDLSPLVSPVAASLEAGRTGAFFNPDVLTEEEMDSTAPHWRMRNGRLAADVRRWTLVFGSNGRKVKGRDDGPDARWQSLTPLLREHHSVVGAELRGLSKRFSIAATTDSTVEQDVENIRETIDDDFHVSSVEVRAKGEAESQTVTVDFGASTVTGNARLAYHLQAARLLTLARPITDEDVEVLLQQ